MSEIAKYKGQSIKIGTCESMYYLTLSDRKKVDYDFDYNYRWIWRLPDMGDYKEPGNGEYEDWKDDSRTYINEARFNELLTEQLTEAQIESNNGSFTISHNNGLRIRVTCTHGRRLPQESADLHVQSDSYCSYYRLSGIRTKGKEIDFIITCVCCGHSWKLSFDELEQVILDKDYLQLLKKEIETYNE